MSLHRSPKPLKLLSLLSILLAPRLINAQISGLFPEYIADCLERCQPLWSANYDCTQAGQSSMDCLCQSGWVEQFYEGSTCTCTSDFEAQEFRNWFDGSNGCAVYVEERIRSSLTASPTPSSTRSRSRSTEDSTSTESESSSRSRATTSAPRTTARTTSEATETTITTDGSTFTTRVTPTRAGGETTSSNPSIATSEPADQGFITEENKKWVIPTIALGGLVVVGSIAVAVAYFVFGCCRKGGRGKYAAANNPAGGAGLLGVPRRKKPWWTSIPLLSIKKSNASMHSKYSQDMSLVDDHDHIDTGYHGANYPAYTPYIHGAPLPPIDEVRSIADSTAGPRDRGLRLDDDLNSDFTFSNPGVTGYTPVGSGNAPFAGGFMPQPAPVAQPNVSGGAFSGFGPATGAGIVGGAAAGAATNRRRDGDPESFPNRYEDLADRRNLDRRSFVQVTPQGSARSTSGPSIIPRKEVPSPAISPIGGSRPETRAVSPPVSTISSISANSSGWGGGGGRLAGRGSGSQQGFPHAPAPIGSGYMPRGEYVEDNR